MTFRTDSMAPRIQDSSCGRSFWGHRGAFTGAALVAFGLLGGTASAQVAGGEAMLALDLLDNGDFATGVVTLDATPRIPWWTPVVFGAGGRDLSRARRGWEGLSGGPQVRDGALVMRPGGADLLTQPVAVFAPFASELRITGRVLGEGVLVVIDGKGHEVAHAVGRASAESWQSFVWQPGKESELQPRIVFGVGAGGPGEVLFDDLVVEVGLPSKTEAQLAAELAVEIPRLLQAWHNGARDTYGPRETTLWVGLVDAETGGLLGTPAPRVGLHPMHGQLVDAAHLSLGGKELRDLCIASARDFMELCIHPRTALPRRWDPVNDVPADNEPLEVGAYLGYLLDLIERGPAEVQEQAFDVSVAMGRALLNATVLPDGNVAALVRPADGWSSTSTVHLRRLDLPAPFARLAGLLQARRVEPELGAALIQASKDAVLEVEFANYWPGKWDSIDPGFDDSYGHIGARSSTMLAALPSEPMLGRLAFSGYDRFAPLWRDALRFGGNIAADQVRCWRIFAELAELQPDHKTKRGTRLQDEVAGLIAMAVRSHLKGEQAAGGHWLDVTIVGFDPATNLPVGDTEGMPQNLLEGLGAVYRKELGLRTDGHRAIFSAVLGSTQKAYAANFGYVGAAPGAVKSGGRGGGSGKSAVGTLQILGGLLAMAENLAR